MEELNGEPPEHRRGWVKFEEEGGSGSRGESEAAVLPVENGTVKDSISEHNSSAVIDTTQVHVNYTSKPRVGSAIASPVPEPAPRSKHLQTVPSVSSNHTAPADTHIQMPTGPVVTLQTGASPGTPEVKFSRPPRPPRPVRSVIRQGFANGDVIVSVLPMNEKCSWLTKAEFRPELVPEELMAEGLTLTVEEYVSALEILVNDLRFSCYTVCYKRALLVWVLLCFTVLLALLFSGVRGLILFGAGVVWLLLNAGGIFICMWFKIKLNKNLEMCVAQINKYLIKHKILMGVDDRGKLSCHKVHLIFIYFDTGDCIRKLNDLIDNDPELRSQMEESKSNGRSSLQNRMDLDETDIIITGSSNTRLSRKPERGERLLLRYSQRWVKAYVRRLLDLCVDVHLRDESGPPAQPRHCISARCPCQYIEEHLRYKPRGKCCGCQFFDM